MFVVEMQIYTSQPTMWIGLFHNKFESLSEAKNKVVRCKNFDKQFRPSEKVRYRIRDELGNIFYQGRTQR